MEPKLIAVIKCFVPGVVLQLQVSQSTDQDVVVFQEHPANLQRGFQQSLKVDNYYQAYHSSKSPLGTSSPWGQGLVCAGMSILKISVRRQIQLLGYCVVSLADVIKKLKIVRWCALSWNMVVVRGTLIPSRVSTKLKWSSVALHVSSAMTIHVLVM